MVMQYFAPSRLTVPNRTLDWNESYGSILRKAILRVSRTQFSFIELSCSTFRPPSVQTKAVSPSMKSNPSEITEQEGKTGLSGYGEPHLQAGTQTPCLSTTCSLRFKKRKSVHLLDSDPSTFTGNEGKTRQPDRGESRVQATTQNPCLPTTCSLRFKKPKLVHSLEPGIPPTSGSTTLSLRSRPLASEQQLFFLDLPVKVRLRIYEGLVLSGRKPHYDGYRVTNNLTAAYGFQTAILTVNKQTNREALKVFYEHNTWSFTILERLGEHRGRSKTQILPPLLPFEEFQNRQHIRKVRLLVHICPGQNPNKNPEFTYNDTDNLAKLPAEAYRMCRILAEHTKVKSVTFVWNDPHAVSNDDMLMRTLRSVRKLPKTCVARVEGNIRRVEGNIRSRLTTSGFRNIYRAA